MLALKFEVASLKLVPSTGGAFEVTVNGRLMWSKKATRQFPDHDLLVAEVRASRGSQEG
ncbi:MAG: Rdx family protein [Verrucomicrobiales bacterium]|nr:Rdx family protein [Verrucomicrobiales bacterium]